VDTHAYAGYVVPPNYDSLVGKLITSGEDRGEAIARMRLALESFIIEGIQTTIPFLLELMNDSAYVAGDVDTKFVERRMAARGATK
jgi:acetyl-CoA carboxylase biotin carboxylase subunit